MNDYSVIDKGYEVRAAIASDIHEHMPTLKRYAEQSDRIIEFGVGWGNSTWSLLAGHPKWMRSYDLKRYEPHFSWTEAATKIAGMDFAFVMQNSAEAPVEPCHLLFIDSAHYYEHCKAELERHAWAVKNWIIFHDTTEFEFTNENRQGRGLWPAIQEFLDSHPEWFIKERFTNCNGLTVLQHL